MASLKHAAVLPTHYHSAVLRPLIISAKEAIHLYFPKGRRNKNSVTRHE
jgi:hypothetical protein